MPFAFISGLSANYGGGGATDTASTGGPIDTTGANLIVVEVSYFDASSAVTVTDNKGNTYTALTGYGGAGVDYRVKLFYCYAPTVGTGHTFVGGVAGAYCSVSIAAFSGAAASPADQSAGSFNSSSSTAQAGSITPTESGELIIATMCNRLDAGSASINDGFTIVDQELWQSGGLGTALAYKIQTAAAATNPTWTLTSAVKNAPAIYSFKAADGGGSTNASDPGGTGTSTGSGTGGDATGSSGTPGSDPGGTGTSTGSGTGGTATGGGSGSFTFDACENNSHSGALSGVAVNWAWHSGGNVGSGTTITNGSGTMTTSGMTISGLPAGVGYGVIRTSDGSVVAYQEGTVS